MNFASRRASGLVVAGAVATTLAFAAPAGATTLTADEAVDSECSSGNRSGEAGVVTETVSVPGVSTVQATLTGAEGNWDLAVLEAKTSRVVTASSYPTGDEIAEGFSAGAGDLIVQACRRTGEDSTAELSVETNELTEQAPRMQIVRVSTPDPDTEGRLVATGLDLTEHGGEGYLDVVLHNPAEGALLTDEGFEFDVIEPDLAAASLQQRAEEAAMAARGDAGVDLPSGDAGPNDGTYRRLFDYSEELQKLAEDNPKLVKYKTLKKNTYSDRPVESITVGKKVAKKDGRPAFLLMGAHHGREWPSAEHTIEFAYEIINGYNDGNKKIKKLLKKTRVIFVPVVNPDGFNTSREAGETGGAAGGRTAPGGDETANLVIPYEYQRKNCRVVPPSEPPTANCMAVPNLGLTQFGVDPNRNYGGFWGGPGASAEDTLPFGSTAQDYRGPGPFSEPETQNIRKLVSKDQVVTLITNHTFSNLLLRPPGLQAKGPPPDEKVYKAFGKSMADENGYSNQKSYELYDTSGGTEDWTYYATGGFGFTFEIGLLAFHDIFADGVVAEYNGTSEASGNGGGNRVAYMKALKSTAKNKRHSRIKGSAPAGARLILKKTFMTPTSPVIDGNGVEGEIQLFKDKLKTKLDVGKNGRYVWHVNPSTRPLVDPRLPDTDVPNGQPSEPVEFSGTAGPDAIPCGDAESEDPMCFNDHPFEVPSGPGIDNGKATVTVTWPTPVSDWDIKVFSDSDGDGTSEGETKVFGSSAQGPSSEEETTIAGPDFKPGDYVVRVVNFAATEPYDGDVVFNKTEGSVIEQGLEKWKLACRKKKGGPVKATKNVLVKRGEAAKVNFAKSCS
ncbi:MAG TPA: M14 family zinc carboxypeptidase [Solirubrobacterales bacterium]|nr:M14 family zinc carboxypeptidase [Solirubrobacterales bacterium]